MFNLTSLLAVLSSALGAYALSEGGCVAFDASSGGFPLVGATIITSEDDFPGVHRAVADFVVDITNVTGTAPAAYNLTELETLPTTALIVGSLNSSVIAGLSDSSVVDIGSLAGQWEKFASGPALGALPGVENAYVIAGSDKRGTIFGLYELSEQIGVSPWYWWADVPIAKHDEVYLLPCAQGPPTVKYRGIFLNDEAPALTNWAKEKFTNGTLSMLMHSPFNHHFYEKLFELILRLKANHLWPAMWGSAFCVDDELNLPMADYYGVVMGTSHQEPMMRSTPNEWNLFGNGTWDYSTNSENIYPYLYEGAARAAPYESIFSMGMRGAGDLPLFDETNIELLTQIVADERQILSDVFNTSDVSTIPQIWTLFQEVQGYYEQGMEIPDDITLLWSDDNWGNIRRFPTPNERNRTGGAGVYYHVDFVGDPRDYKWIESSQISKIYEQMSLAVEYEATRVWMLNVGDLKPYERSTEFFLTLGWNASRWTPENLSTFVTSWAKRDFQVEDKEAETIADIVANYTKLNARRKPELWNSTTYSLTNYREAASTLAEWNTVRNASTVIHDGLAPDIQPAYFQLVHHAVLASANLGEMYILAGMNNLYASQARFSTNDLADKVQALFEADYDLEERYHSIIDGKWDHMMDQTHIGYYYWQQPMTNTMPAVNRVQTRKNALAGVMRIIPEGTEGAWPGDNPHQCAKGYDCGNPTIYLDRHSPISDRYVDVAAGGPAAFTWNVSSNASWVSTSLEGGNISPDDKETRLYLRINDWSAVDGLGVAQLTFVATSSISSPLTVNLTFIAYNPGAPPEGFSGFVEGDGVVSFEASHAARNTAVGNVTWTEIPQYGRTLSGVTPWPRTDANFTAGSGPSLEYNFCTFGANATDANVTVYLSPAWNSQGLSNPLTYGLQVDDADIQTVAYIPYPETIGGHPAEWAGLDGFVANNIATAKTSFVVGGAGAHTLKLWMTQPTVVVQKIVIDLGGALPSYLGPPESVYVG
ncbi:GH115 alpha-glucuronidase [Schizophyllum fasciatum]